MLFNKIVKLKNNLNNPNKIKFFAKESLLIKSLFMFHYFNRL